MKRKNLWPGLLVALALSLPVFADELPDGVEVQRLDEPQPYVLAEPEMPQEQPPVTQPQPETEARAAQTAPQTGDVPLYGAGALALSAAAFALAGRVKGRE